MPIPGSATPDATDAYRARVAATSAPEHFRFLAGCRLSSVGIGTYLGAEDDATDRSYYHAVSKAVERGGNVIDTAINYRHQRSERVIGLALRDLIARGAAKREEVVIATKGGFVPFDGAAPPDPRGYVVDTYIRTGLLTADDVAAGCHAVAPKYLADQIERSRRNLGIQTLDIYYVHNPETQLGDVPRPEFLRRMREAFAVLEQAVVDGAIRMYGTATWNGYRQSPDAADHLSLAELVGVARDVAGEGHHFKVIQLPYNLAMTEAFLRPTQVVSGEAVSTLEAARRLGMYVMTSASIYQGQLSQHLPPIVGELLPGLDTDAQRAIQFVRSTPGVGTGLVGMKTVAHVEANLRVANTPPVPWSEFQRLFHQG